MMAAHFLFFPFYVYLTRKFIFVVADLRMELLDGETNDDLLRALQALLMLLPQSNAFRILRDRLNCLQRVSPNLNRLVLIIGAIDTLQHEPPSYLMNTLYKSTLYNLFI